MDLSLGIFPGGVDLLDRQALRPACAPEVLLSHGPMDYHMLR